MSADIQITEVVLRDGLQLEKRILSTEVKLSLARQLALAGLNSLEVGSFVRGDHVPQMADTAELLPQVSSLPGVDEAITLVFNARGAQRAIDAGARRVRLVVSASDAHSVANAGVPTDQALDRLAESVELLTTAGVVCEGNIATAFVCPFDGDTPPERSLRVARRLLEFGVQALCVADTIGAAHPGQVKTLLGRLAQEFSDVPLGIHLHNTYGMASANALVALEQGVRRFDSSVGALGGCPFAPGATGNVGTDDMVHLFHRLGLSTGVDVHRLAAARIAVEDAVGHPLASALSGIPAAPAQLQESSAAFQLP